MNLPKPIVSVLLLSFFSLAAQPGFAQAQDLTELSLEELMDVEVYSAAKKKQRFFEVPAAVYVITPEDIRRSGAASIPELLRMVPGVIVQKVNSNTWDISARGFNGSIFSNKLLVLIDGRAVYTPLFAGVFWDVQDVVLEDIERIEVIRGPGGAVWGANAVNGVVNIITKSAQDTQGTLVVAGGGNEERGFGTLRHGDRVGDWYYRSYAKYVNRDDGFSSDGGSFDEWDVARGGFRMDNGELTFQGDFYQGNIGQQVTGVAFSDPFRRTITDPEDVHGWNLLARYAQADWFLQLYWDVTSRNLHTFAERRDKIDVEYTRQLHLNERHEIIWGLGYRINMETVSNTEAVAISEPSETDQIFSLFIQDEIKVSEKLKFILGSKFEHNIYTGFEFQPNARLSYQLDEDNLVWAAVSRAVRTPSRLEVDGQLTGAASAPALFTRTVGNKDLSSEKLLAYEIGYRHQPNHNLFFDLVLFAHHYDDLITFDVGDIITDRGFPVRTFPSVNGQEGEVHGVELAGDIRLRKWWKIKAAYAVMKLELHTDSDVSNSLGLEKGLEDVLPMHDAYLRSSFDLPRGFELDTTLRYMSSYTYGGKIPSIVEMDIRLARIINGWRVTLVGQNLIEEHHKEAGTSAATQVERGGYLKVTREF